MTKNEPKRQTLLHDPRSPDVFADGCAGIFTFNGNMRITFHSVRSDYSVSPATTDPIVIGRLVMPLASAVEMARLILDQAEKLRTEPPAQTTTVQ